MKSNVSALGIFLSALGAFLVWRFIGEINFADKQAYLKGEGVMEVPNPSPKDINALKTRIKISRIGLSCIVVGGILQMIGIYMS